MRSVGLDEPVFMRSGSGSTIVDVEGVVVTAIDTFGWERRGLTAAMVLV
jgi:hypothetical protein